MDPATDLIEHFRLDVVLFPDHTRHTFYQSEGRQNRRKVKVVKKWIRQQEIGEGGGGTVWLEKDNNGDERAVKEISKRFCLESRIDYKREITAMAKMTKYPELFVELHGWFDDDTKVFLAMEYFRHGDLQNFMDSPLPERVVGIITRQLLEGLNVMHKHGFTHRDLKPQNIFVVADSPSWWVKIGDFGITKRIMGDKMALRTEVGTRDYQAPEVRFADSEEELLYTSAVDLWALGCVMYRLLTLEKPFARPLSLKKYCYSIEDFPVEPLYAKDVSKDAVEFIRQLMRAHPPERLDAETALKAHWRGLQDSISGSETDSIAGEKVAAIIPAQEDDTLPTQAIMTTTSSKDKRSRTENDTDSVISGEVTVISHAPRIERVVDLQQPGLRLENIHMNQSIEQDLEQESFMPGDELHDEDVNYENHIVLNVDTLNLVTKETSDTTDQEEGLEKHSDLPAYLTTVESDATPAEAEIPTSMKDICPKCYLGGGLRVKNFPAESTATVVYCATHDYTIKQDTATLKELHQTGYLLDVETLSADLSTNLDAITALHLAAKSGYLWKLRYLLDRGVNPSAIDNGESSQKRAALHFAASGGFSKEVDVLIEKGADVQALDAKSWSPLHHAAEGGFRTISEALLKAGASLQSLNEYLETPLHCAARSGHIHVIRLLLDRGADISTKDWEGFTPFDRAEKANHTIEALRVKDLPIPSIPEPIPEPVPEVIEGMNWMKKKKKRGKKSRSVMLWEDDDVSQVMSCEMHNTLPEVLLLDRGADISTKDWEGFTPFDRAEKANHTIEALRVKDLPIPSIPEPIPSIPEPIPSIPEPIPSIPEPIPSIPEPITEPITEPVPEVIEGIDKMSKKRKKAKKGKKVKRISSPILWEDDDVSQVMSCEMDDALPEVLESMGGRS